MPVNCGVLANGSRPDSLSRGKGMGILACLTVELGDVQFLKCASSLLSHGLHQHRSSLSPLTVCVTCSRDRERKPELRIAVNLSPHTPFVCIV